MLHAIRLLSENIPKNGSVLPQKTIGVRINEPSFLGGTRRLRARLSLPNQVVRARIRTVLTEGRTKTLRHSQGRSQGGSRGSRGSPPFVNREV